MKPGMSRSRGKRGIKETRERRDTTAVFALRGRFVSSEETYRTITTLFPGQPSGHYSTSARTPVEKCWAIFTVSIALPATEERNPTGFFSAASDERGVLFVTEVCDWSANGKAFCRLFQSAFECPRHGTNSWQRIDSRFSKCHEIPWPENFYPLALCGYRWQQMSQKLTRFSLKKKSLENSCFVFWNDYTTCSV